MRPPVIAAVAVAVALAAGAYFWFFRGDRAPDSAATAPAPTAVEVEPQTTERPAPLPVTVPPLGESDPLVRQLVAALSSHPAIAAWLTTDGLIRNFVVVVDNIASGASPTRHLRVLRPTGPFATAGDAEDLRIDPRSFARYDRIADAAASIDANGAASLYATLDPRLEEAYQELGNQDGFDTALQRALTALLRVPVIDEDEPVQFKGALVAYSDPRLESLTPAQKQLLRMGPRNVRIIQNKLREIAAALGMRVSG